MNRIDDQGLVTTGLRPEGTGRILLLACGALAREVIDLREANGWTHMDLHCLPAILHNHPEKIPDAVERAVSEARDRYDTIFVLYADCGTGGLLQARCAALGVEMLEGPHCYSFFEGNASVIVPRQVPRQRGLSPPLHTPERFFAMKGFGPSDRPSPAPGSRHRRAGRHGCGRSPARGSGARISGGVQAALRASHSASSTSASSARR
jgi:hypothetical protein